MTSQNISRKPSPIPLTTRTLLKQALPPLNYRAYYHTTSKALHDIHFTGPLEPWDGFEESVCNFRSTVEKHYDVEKILGYASSEPSKNDITFVESFHCGDELSVSGRYVANALHVMSAVGKDVGLETVFGDWKSTEKKEKKEKKGKKKERINEDNDDEKDKDRKESDKKEAKESRLTPDFSIFNPAFFGQRAVGEAKTPWHHGIGIGGSVTVGRLV
jgi:hypothetical protein